MSNFLQMANIQSLLFIYMLVGYGCCKFRILDIQARKYFTDFVVYITLPCMIFNSFSISLTIETLKVGSLAIFIAIGVALFALLLGKFLYFWCKDEKKKRIMQYGTLVSNSGFAGLPVIESAYGAEGLFLASLFIIPTRILMWSAGISLFTTQSRAERMKSILLNPGIIAVFVGILNSIFAFSLPTQIDKAINSLGACTTPLAMIVVGMILSQVNMKTVISGKAVIVSAVRLLGIPLVLLAVLKIFNVDYLTMSVAVILTGMPLGSTTAILAAKYDMDADFASKGVFISTVGSLFTVPLLTLFL